MSAATEFTLWRNLERVLRLYDVSDPDHPVSDEAKSLRSQVIERMALLAPRVRAVSP